ncbi:response regulator [Cytophagaceae bacterium ABcell3]|nr:response regulator [Cytophagaceae bacterium ABcell3]
MKSKFLKKNHLLLELMYNTYFNTILLVDDDYVNNFVTERLLRKSGLAREIKAVRNGEDALTYLAESKNKLPELILLDINMPEMDGINFLKYFKKMILDKNIRIILLTGTVTPEYINILNNLGFPDIIEKPFTDQKLQNILKKDLEAKRA